MSTRNKVGLAAFIVLLMASSSLAKAQPLGERETALITVHGARPLADALGIFEDRYGFVVTYEDPRYEHEAHLVRKPRLVVPAGGSFAVEYPVPRPDDPPSVIGEILTKIVDAYNTSGLPGRFEVAHTGKAFHVTPQAVLGRQGQILPQRSVLEAPVSMPGEKGRSLHRALLGLCAALSGRIGYRVDVGVVPNNLVTQTLAEQAYEEQPARELLLTLLALTGGDLSWRLQYDPGGKRYVLNIRIVNLK